ncbi:Ornithine decarboxylase antizyme [Escovopsis weberi]|uniref:Ornithine decarboxylase antizyme n=1 Tax=Escovopsis weberi TaxID=150374 RepID=A0A0M8N262_ESCWE|nr:Ornithine decarboxylase antizyme [Escovopsis weberi]
MQTPPPDYHFERQYISNGTNFGDALADHPNRDASAGFGIDAWMEVWDYAGGASFRAFQVSDGREKSLFIFFDAEGVMGRDLKKALMALIELGDGPLGCAHIVTCIDRRLPAEKAHELIKSLQWVGFEMTTLDHWANGLDVTSKEWVFMGMEL